MKNLFFLIVPVLIITMTSCKRSWNCICDITETYSNGTQSSVNGHVQQLDGMSKKDAQAKCTANNGTSTYSTPIQGTVTKNTDCSLKATWLGTSK